MLLIGRGLPEAQTGAALTAYLLASTAGGLAGGYLSDRLGRREVLVASSILAIPIYYWFFSLSAGIAWLPLFLASACFGVGFPGCVVLAQEYAPQNRGMASGMMMGLGFGLGAMLAPVTGAVADARGLETALRLSLALLVASGALGGLLPGRRFRAGRTNQSCKGGV